MPSYDFYVNPGSKPNINEALYGQASNAGINAGNAQKTPLQAGIEGLTQGVTTGLNWAGQLENIESANLQQEAMRQDIKYNPIIKQQGIERNKLELEIKQLDLDLAQQTHELSLEETKQVLTAKKEQATYATKVIRGKGKIADALASSQPGASAGILRDPDAMAAINSDPIIGLRTMAQLASRGDITKDQFEDYRDGINKQQKIGYAESLRRKHEEANRKQYELAVDAINGESTKKDDETYHDVQTILNKGNFKGPEDLIDKTVSYPKGMMTWDNSKKTFVVNPDYVKKNEHGTKDNLFDIFSSDGKHLATIGNTTRGYIETYKQQGPKNNDDLKDLKPYVPPTVSEEETIPGGRTSPFDGRNENVIKQAADDLVARAEVDPALAKKLLEQGLIEESGFSADSLGSMYSLPERRYRPTEKALQGGQPSMTPVAPTIQYDATGKTATTDTEQYKPLPIPKTPEVFNETYNKMPKEVRSALPSEAPKVAFKIENNAKLKGLSSLEKAVVAAESGGDADVSDNVADGRRYLNKRLNAFMGNEYLALLAYNVDPEYIKQAINNADSLDYPDVVESLEYLHRQGRLKNLTKTKLTTGIKYPRKVMAFKQIFDSV